MTSSVDDVAAAVLETAGSTTTMGLQKLVYYCQAWHLVRHGQSLFPDEVEAWRDGPVVQRLYARHQGERRITHWPAGDADRLDPAAWGTVIDVVKRYGSLSAEALSELTHIEAPWVVARSGLPLAAPSRRPISRDLMRDYYARQLLAPTEAVADAVASTEAEGLEVTTETRKLALSVAEGSVNADEAVAEALARWTERG